MIDVARSHPFRPGPHQARPARAAASPGEEGSSGPGAPGPLGLDRLGEEIARLSAHIQAATHRLLVLIRAFDAREGWHAEGFRSCAEWLSWRTGIAPGAAREKVRVARALGALPALSGALEAGRLSYSAARALTRVATPENEAELVEVARHLPASQLERLVAGWRAADRAEEAERERERHARRALWVLPEADGSWVLRGRLDPEAGAVLRKALEAAGEALYGRSPAGPECPAEARRADALGLLAEAALGGGLGATEAHEDPEGGSAAEDGADPAAGEGADARPERARPARVVGRAERFQVVVHVSAETLAGDGAAAGDRDASGAAVAGEGPTAAEPPRIEGGPRVSAETARRLGCDAGVVVMTHDREGSVLDVGRRRRAVPPAIRRALEHRDGGCRFPGCGSRFCDAHHIRHWAKGGATKLDNLVLLCRRHHWLLHEGGWRMKVEPGADGGGPRGGPALRFHRPDGRLLPERPPVPDLGQDPVGGLERAQRGLGIDEWTPTPRWDGARLDVDWALLTLRTPAEPRVSTGLTILEGRCRDRRS